MAEITESKRKRLTAKEILKLYKIELAQLLDAIENAYCAAVNPSKKHGGLK